MNRFARCGWLLVAMVAVAIASSPLRAQVATPGSRVRIAPVGGGAQTEGTLVAMTTDTISLHPGMGNALLLMPMDSVRTVDQSLGIQSNFGTVMKDGGIGAAIGIGAVALVGAGICHFSHDDLCGLGAVLIAVPVGLAGFITGAVVGRGKKKDIWQRVYERPQSTSLLIGPTRHGGVALGLSVAFGSSSQAP